MQNVKLTDDFHRQSVENDNPENGGKRFTRNNITSFISKNYIIRVNSIDCISK